MILIVLTAKASLTLHWMCIFQEEDVLDKGEGQGRGGDKYIRGGRGGGDKYIRGCRWYGENLV